MKILFLSSRVPFPVRDGHTRRTYNILRGLGRRHDVHFLSLSDSAGDLQPAVRTHFEAFCSGFECLNAPPKKVGLPMLARLVRSLFSADPYTLWRHYSPEYLDRVRTLIRTRQFDLVHCDILPLAYTVRAGAAPFTLTDHDVCYLKARRIAKQSSDLLLKAFSALEWRKLKRFEKSIFSKVDLGIAVSETDRKLLQELCPAGNFAVVENGVDTRAFSPGPGEPDAETLVWVGGFGYAPNRDALSYFLGRIYPLIKKEAPRIRFDVIGAGVTERLRQYAARDPSLNLAGYVDDPVPVLRRAGVFVAPIRSGSGTRLKTLEAMAAGRAIVTTGIGCEGIEGKHGEHYLIADAPQQFAESVLALVRDRLLRRRLGANARRLAVSRYDWNVVLDRMDRVYTELGIRRAQSK